jgi:hypothetical protein
MGYGISSVVISDSCSRESFGYVGIQRMNENLMRLDVLIVMHVKMTLYSGIPLQLLGNNDDEFLSQHYRLVQFLLYQTYMSNMC